MKEIREQEFRLGEGLLEAFHWRLFRGQVVSRAGATSTGRTETKPGWQESSKQLLVHTVELPVNCVK